MIKFEYDNSSSTDVVYFSDVKHDQFFIHIEGYLCQKNDSNNYSMIATPEGIPYSISFRVDDIDMDDEDMIISKILPIVTKITWE